MLRISGKCEGLVLLRIYARLCVVRPSGDHEAEPAHFVEAVPTRTPEDLTAFAQPAGLVVVNDKATVVTLEPHPERKKA